MVKLIVQPGPLSSFEKEPEPTIVISEESLRSGEAGRVMAHEIYHFLKYLRDPEWEAETGWDVLVDEIEAILWAAMKTGTPITDYDAFTIACTADTAGVAWNKLKALLKDKCEEFGYEDCAGLIEMVKSKW